MIPAGRSDAPGTPPPCGAGLDWGESAGLNADNPTPCPLPARGGGSAKSYLLRRFLPRARDSFTTVPLSGRGVGIERGARPYIDAIGASVSSA